MKKFLKKSLKKKRLLMSLATAGIAAVALPIVLTSCSTTTSDNTQLGVQTFEATQKYVASGSQLFVTKEDSNTIQKPETLEVVDPNLNNDAIAKAEDTFRKTLTKEKLQQDFDKVLRKFYKAYEYEIEEEQPGAVEEAEIIKIVVDSFDANALEAKLTVHYKAEISDSEDNDRTRDNDEKEITQSHTFKIKPHFATLAEIDNISNMLEKLKNKDDDQDGVNFEIDVEDLWELYVGNPGDNKESIFEQVQALTTTSSKYGGLLGYSINVSDLAYKEEGSKLRETDLTKTNLFAPSSIIKDFFKPNVETVITSQGIDLTLSYEKISTKTKDELLKIKSYNGTIDEVSGGESVLTDGTTSQTKTLGLKEILMNAIPTDKESLIKAVLVQEIPNSNGDLEVRVQIQTEETDMPTFVQLMIDGTWYKSTPTTSGGISV